MSQMPLDEPLDPSVPRPPSGEDLLWWMKEHTLEVLKCLDKIHSAQTTPQERELAAGFLESHITALQLSYGKYQEFLSWMNRPEHREESTPQPDREAWDADYEGIVHEDDAQEDGA